MQGFHHTHTRTYKRNGCVCSFNLCMDFQFTHTQCIQFIYEIFVIPSVEVAHLYVCVLLRIPFGSCVVIAFYQNKLIKRTHTHSPFDPFYLYLCILMCRRSKFSIFLEFTCNSQLNDWYKVYFLMIVRMFSNRISLTTICTNEHKYKLKMYLCVCIDLRGP